MRNKFLPVFILIIIFLIKPVFSQHTYYVCKNGKDSYNGLSISNSFLTLQKAAHMVSTGDSVLVLEGNYTGFDIRTSGSENSPIVFKAVNQNVIINEPNYKTSDGINIENANWIVIEGFKVINQPRAGIATGESLLDLLMIFLLKIIYVLIAFNSMVFMFPIVETDQL